MAIGTRLPKHITIVFLVDIRERRPAIEALRLVSFCQTRIEPNSFVEYKTFPRVVRGTAVFEVFQNPAVQLKNLLETLTLHVRPRFFASDATRTKHHDRSL